MANYLNPSLLADGIDSLAGKYIGWILVGKPVDADDGDAFLNGQMPVSDACIAGIMQPVEVSLSSIKGGKFKKGTITLYTNPTDTPTAPQLTGDSITGDDGSYTTFSDASKVSVVGNTILSVTNTVSASSVIFPSGIISGQENSRYININSGKVLLVQYKNKPSWSEDKQTDNTLVYDLISKYTNNQSEFVPPNSSDWIEKYIEKILFSYDVTPSGGLYQCNDYNYTGFTVGDINVNLNGFTSN